MSPDPSNEDAWLAERIDACPGNGLVAAPRYAPQCQSDLATSRVIRQRRAGVSMTTGYNRKPSLHRRKKIAAAER